MYIYPPKAVPEPKIIYMCTISPPKPAGKDRGVVFPGGLSNVATSPISTTGSLSVVEIDRFFVVALISLRMEL